MKKIIASMLLFGILFTFGMLTASADIYEHLTYEVIDEEVVITFCDYEATTMEIPAQIGTYPVTGIGDYAFSGTIVTRVQIPASVNTIGELAFLNASSLESISVDENNAYYSSADGVLFDKNMTELLCFPLGNSATSYTLPDTVATVNANAFGSNDKLKSITFGKNAKNIDGSAFSDCMYIADFFVDTDNEWFTSSDGILFNKNKTELVRYPAGKVDTTYTIPAGVTRIGNYAFGDCDIESIELPEGLISIGESAFEWCSKLTSVGTSLPDSLTSIGRGAFTGCYLLTDMIIPDGVTAIEDLTFSFCDGLTNIKIGKSVKSIGAYAFSNCTGLTDITDILGDNSLESIGVCAFENCTSLTSVTIPDSVIEMQDEVFLGCTNLKSVVIGNGMTYVSRGMLEGCISLTYVTIPDSVTEIKTYAFSNCSGLKNITIGEGVTYIGSQSFEGCVNLESITLPQSIEIISNTTFKDCVKLTTVNYNGTEEDWSNVWTNWDNDPLINATRNYFWYVKYIDENGMLIKKDMVTHNSLTTPSADIGNMSDGIFFADEGLTTAFDFMLPITQNTTVYIKGTASSSAPYKINSITIKDSSGNSLAAIPAGSFLATVSITNKNSDVNNVVVLASYSSIGILKNLMYVGVEDMPVGATFKLTIPVDNTTGDVAKLKAFVWNSFDSMVVLGETVSFPTE